MTLKEQLVSYLYKQESWVHKGVILDIKWYHANQNKRYMPNTVDRELRHAEEESQIAVKDDQNGKSIMYKYLPKDRRSRYIPWSMREDKSKLFT